MTFDDPAPLIASALVAAGLACLFLSWRVRARATRARRAGVAAGWALAAAGIVIWARADSPEVGAALAVAAAMLLALALVGAHSLSLPAPRKALRETRTDAAAAPPARGARMRAGARLAGSLAAAPAFGLALGLAVMRWSGGDPATRLVAMAFAAVLGAAGALIFVLASRRPVGATVGLTAFASLFALLVIVPGGAA